MKSDGIGFELLLASILPVSGILVVGVIALGQMASVDIDIRFFLVILLACVLGAFFGELALLRFMERAKRAQVAELVAVCRDYLAGKRERRAIASADDMFGRMASTINALLDWATIEISVAGSEQSVAASRVPHLDTQVQQLVYEISPVLESDLCVHATVPPGKVGLLASVCNRLVEQLIELVMWTRYSSEQFNETTRDLTNRSMQVEQMAETYLKNFSEVASSIEKLVAFMQYLCHALHMKAEIVREIQTCVQQTQRHESAHLPGEEQPATRRKTKSTSVRLPADLLARLNEDVEQQSNLVGEISQVTEEHIVEVKLMMTKLYEFAQKLYELCSKQVQSVEKIEELALLANKWHNAVGGFQLPDDANLSSRTGSTSEWIL